jgi:hypothetical protein
VANCKMIIWSAYRILVRLSGKQDTRER